MHETTSFAVEVKRPSSLPTVRNQTDIVKERRSSKAEAQAFDSGITSHRNTIGIETTRATTCGQKSAKSKME
jgi:ribosomal protein S10